MSNEQLDLNNLPKKANYKIFNKNVDKYVSNGRKTTWATINGVSDAAQNLRFSNSQLEIHIFPVETAIKVPLEKLIEFFKEENELKLKKKAEKFQKLKTENEKRHIKEEMALLKRKEQTLKNRARELNIDISKL